MNSTFKQWMTHPVLLGAMVGIFIGSIYLVFNANLEEEGPDSPINIAISPTLGAHSIDSHEDKIQDKQQELKQELSQKAASVVEEPPLVEISKLEAEKPKAVLAQSEQKQQAALEKTEQAALKTVATAHTSTGRYTIQLLGAGSEANVKKFIQHHGLDKKAHYVRTKRSQKDWFVVYYGDYSSAQEAKAALSTMPVSLKKEGVQPWVRQSENVHQELKQG